MKKVLLATLALASSPALAATTVVFTPGASPNPASIIQNFDSMAPATPLGTNALVFASSVPNVAARPAFNSTGNFGAVLGTPTAGSASFSFAPSRGFSFALGSLDTYNTLTLKYSDNSTLVLNGAQIALGALANGNQTLPNSNGRVFYQTAAGDPLLVGATFGSTQNSFEFDNLAVGVPEPASWALLISGFGFVGGALRRRRATMLRFA